MDRQYLTIRAPESELQILDRYCAATKRKRTDVVREWLRQLEPEVERLEQQSQD